jgi:hypothetical protein
MAESCSQFKGNRVIVSSSQAITKLLAICLTWSKNLCFTLVSGVDGVQSSNKLLHDQINAKIMYLA